MMAMLECTSTPGLSQAFLPFIFFPDLVRVPSPKDCLLRTIFECKAFVSVVVPENTKNREGN